MRTQKSHRFLWHPFTIHPLQLVVGIIRINKIGMVNNNKYTIFIVNAKVESIGRNKNRTVVLDLPQLPVVLFPRTNSTR